VPSPAAVVRDAVARATAGPFRAGLAIAIAAGLALLLASGSVVVAAWGAAVVLPFALTGTYAVDTAREWRDWLSSPDSPLATPGGDPSRARSPASTGGTATARDTRAQLVRLRERYVEGEIDEATFERKLAVLLDTETPEAAREHVRAARATATDDGPGREGRRARDAGDLDREGDDGVDRDRDRGRGRDRDREPGGADRDVDRTARDPDRDRDR
jgi:hypothetical protein